MCKNFFENMHRLLVFIRSDIYNHKNIVLTKILIDCIEKELTNRELIEMVINTFPQLKEQLVLQDDEVYKMEQKAKDFVLKALYILTMELENGRYDSAYDTADMLHIFPHIIISNSRRQINNYWKIYVNPIREKCHIKRKELKRFRKGRM